MSNQLKKQSLVTPRDLHVGLNPHPRRQLLRRRQDALGRRIAKIVSQWGAMHGEAQIATMCANIVNARGCHVSEAPDEVGGYGEFLLADDRLRYDVLIIEH